MNGFFCAYMIAGLGLTAAAQSSQPQTALPMKVNVINVCTPLESDTAELRSALESVTLHPEFGIDREVARGWTTTSASDLPVDVGGSAEVPKVISKWVRLNRDFPERNPLLSAQYSFAVEHGEATETLVFYFRQTASAKALQLSISGSAKLPEPASLFFAVPGIASRIRVERFGKSSLVLARCTGQPAVYDPLLAAATQILQSYRSSLQVRSIVPAELMRLGPEPKPVKSAAKNSAPKAAASKPVPSKAITPEPAAASGASSKKL